MRASLGALALLALAACTPPSSGAHEVVREIYATAQENLGQQVTPMDDIPMTEDLRSLLDRAEAAADAREEPFIEGDLALNCQDCASLDGLVVGPQTGAEQEPAVEGHTWVQAVFRINGDEARRVLWDMVETDAGWRVDNIVADGHDLRAEAAAYLDNIENDPPPAPAP